MSFILLFQDNIGPGSRAIPSQGTSGRRASFDMLLV
jgi:hypothetical protein